MQPLILLNELHRILGLKGLDVHDITRWSFTDALGSRVEGSDPEILVKDIGHQPLHGFQRACVVIAPPQP